MQQDKYKGMNTFAYLSSDYMLQSGKHSINSLDLLHVMYVCRSLWK